MRKGGREEGTGSGRRRAAEAGEERRGRLWAEARVLPHFSHRASGPCDLAQGPSLPGARHRGAAAAQPREDPGQTLPSCGSPPSKTPTQPH